MSLCSKMDFSLLIFFYLNRSNVRVCALFLVKICTIIQEAFHNFFDVKDPSGLMFIPSRKIAQGSDGWIKKEQGF